MKTQGFVIARNRARDQFFTASSAYDRPKWIPLGEATVYLTAELAESAFKKLARAGAYECRIVPVKEAFEFQLPDQSSEQDMEQPEVDIVPDGDGNSEMVASDQETPCEVCDHCPCTCDGDEDGVDDMVDAALGDDQPVDDQVGDLDALAADELESRMSADGAALAQQLPAGRRGMAESSLQESAGTEMRKHATTLKKEGNMRGYYSQMIKYTEHMIDTLDREVQQAGRLSSSGKTKLKTIKQLEAKLSEYKKAKSALTETTMPAKPPLDAVTPGNKTTVLDLKAPETIKFKDPANVADKPDTDLCNSTAHPHEEKVKVPAEVLSDLKSCIDEFTKEAKAKNTYNDTRAAFCMTVAGAFEQLLMDLEMGTVEGIKQAQIHMTSYMNPITAHLPLSVQKFITMGGRKPTLKDMFNAKRDERKKEEFL